MLPEFGKAGMPYAKTVRSAKKMHGVKPDPELLFDRRSFQATLLSGAMSAVG